MAAILAVIATGCNNKKNSEPDTNNSKETGTVNDICGNTYKYVKIGSHYWLAENMRCNKYDTESEQREVILPKYRFGKQPKTHKANSWEDFYPYYDDYILTSCDCSGSLSNEQIQKFGFYYSWTAAVGLATEAEARSLVKDSDGNLHGIIGVRQGICPNGWHIPTEEELCELIKYTGVESSKALKSKSGWCDDGNGTNSSGFDALPTSDPGTGSCIGRGAYFWLTCNSGTGVYNLLLECSSSIFHGGGGGSFDDIDYLYSVRCVKN